MRTESGFNLIEVLIALALLAVVVTVSMQASLGDTVSYSLHKDEAFARWVALNQIASMQLSGKYPEASKTKGDALLGGIKWQWQQEISNTADKDLRRIQVEVFREDSPNSRVTVQTGFIANPEPKPIRQTVPIS